MNYEIILLIVLVICLIIYKSMQTKAGGNYSMSRSNDAKGIVSQYAPISSNQQISNLVRRSVDEYYRACRLLTKFITGNKNDRIRFIHEITMKPESDSAIYFRMKPRMKQLSDTYNDHIQMAWRVKKLIANVTQLKNAKYLDVGCGQICEKTRAIGETLGLEPQNIWGTDIATWMGREQSEVPKINFKLITDDRLAFANGEFDIATCLMVLHHLPSPSKTIAEIARILKPGGICVLREHDAQTDADRMICDIEHMAYASARISHTSRGDFEREYNAKSAEYYGVYYSAAEIAQMMIAGGFEPISGPIFGDPEHVEISVNRAYLACFRKTAAQ